jgi:hypothetical protein
LSILAGFTFTAAKWRWLIATRLDRVPDEIFKQPGQVSDTLALGERTSEDVAAEIRQSIRAAGRVKGGVLGAAMAGAMLALQEIYEGPPVEELTIVADADGDPHDLDTDGVRLSIAGQHISTPPIKRNDPDDPAA